MKSQEQDWFHPRSWSSRAVGLLLIPSALVSPSTEPFEEENSDLSMRCSSVTLSLVNSSKPREKAHLHPLVSQRRKRRGTHAAPACAFDAETNGLGRCLARPLLSDSLFQEIIKTGERMEMSTVRPWLEIRSPSYHLMLSAWTPTILLSIRTPEHSLIAVKL